MGADRERDEFRAEFTQVVVIPREVVLSPGEFAHMVRARVDEAQVKTVVIDKDGVVWMAVIAGLIAFEKTIPWRRVASYATAAVLLALGLLVLAAPQAIPGLTTPGNTPMEQMTPMG